MASGVAGEDDNGESRSQTIIFIIQPEDTGHLIVLTGDSSVIRIRPLPPMHTYWGFIASAMKYFIVFKY